MSLGTGFSKMQLRAQLESPVILSSFQHTGKLYLENRNINVPVQASVSVSLSRANRTQERCNKEKKYCLHSRKTVQITREVLLKTKRQECPLSHRALQQWFPGTGYFLLCKVPVKSFNMGLQFVGKFLDLPTITALLPLGGAASPIKRPLTA